jgi:hypothetical protein
VTHDAVDLLEISTSGARSRSASRSLVPSSRRIVSASTTVTIVSRAATSPSETPSSSRNANVVATGIGSLIPVDSITMWSKRPSAASRPISTTRSSRSVQQMHPFVISTSCSSARRTSECRTIPASTLISLMSLTITATRRSSRLSRIRCSRVVFPAPRNPDSTVTGTRPTVRELPGDSATDDEGTDAFTPTDPA